MIQTILFDLDGTLVDTEPLHFAAHQKALLPFGLTLTMEEYMRYGMSVDRHVFYQTLSEILGVAIDVPRAGIEKKKYYVEMLKGVQLFPGVEEVLQELTRTYACHVVSSSDVETIEYVLDITHIRKYFQKVYSTKDAERPKPFPDVYFDVLTDLGVDAHEVVVIEDSMSGAKAAIAANLRCVVILNQFTHTQDFAFATSTLGSFKELPEALSRLES